MTFQNPECFLKAIFYHPKVKVRRYIQKNEAKEYVKRGRQKPLYEESAFPCKRWLSSNDDDKKTERQLKCEQRTLHFD